MISRWKIISYIILPSIAIFFFILLIFNFQAYLTQTSSMIYYPYKVSVTPKITEQGQFTTTALFVIRS
jgi:hypothetical protein